ncbi:class II aldolase/adducin family protein [Effusibacillus lacus]|uniref:Class II aldolase n=1 Tax=Effusibacillus lacus TaxID=1348429 RepID=A0A292YS95_9BACL|nr:class II aldolase/adducin family protein [Effusibacillus lacus]TCS76138.1 L-fuculose-phosphate aldolase [Effusibacillus lacus]GAX91355.1 class II aldolase [Effusibacillus lacus]
MNILELKQMLVCGIRLMERTQLIDFNGHFSVRVPETNLLMMNSGKSVRSSLTVDDIVTIDMDGNLVDGNDAPPMEFHIHTEIYKRREDVGAVAHTHPKWSTLFTMTKVPLKPVFPQGALLGEIPVYPKAYSINNRLLGEEVAGALGDKKALLLKAHGAVIVGEGIKETFVLGYYLEENAYRQYMASSLGHVHALDEDEIKTLAANLWKPHLIQKVWDNLNSKMLKE